MVPFNDDCSKETVDDLKDVINSQNKRIGQLQSKLEIYLEVVVERDTLQELCNGLEQWKSEIESHHNKIYCELKNALNHQKEKFSKLKAEERKREETVTKLQDTFDCVREKLKTHKSNENRLQLRLTECETNLERVQDELCRTKAERDKIDGELECATAWLKRAEEDAAARRCELDRLNDSEARNEELERKLRDGELALRTLTESRDALCAASERSRCDAAGRVSELTAVARAKDDELNRAKDVIVELRRENKRAAAESRALRDRARDCERQLDRLRAAAAAEAIGGGGGGGPAGRPSPIDDDTVKAIMAKYLPPVVTPAAVGRDDVGGGGGGGPGCLVDEMDTMKCELTNVRRDVENLAS